MFCRSFVSTKDKDRKHICLTGMLSCSGMLSLSMNGWEFGEENTVSTLKKKEVIVICSNEN